MIAQQQHMAFTSPQKYTLLIKHWVNSGTLADLDRSLCAGYAAMHMRMLRLAAASACKCIRPHLLCTHVLA